MYIDSLYNSFKKIARIIKYGNLSHINSTVNKKNSSNESIKQMDIISQNYIIDSIKNIPNIIGYISEEVEDICIFENKKNITSDKKFILAFDPIDGTKNLLSNITVGTIYCLYEFDYDKKMILNIEEAGYCLYGPKTVLVKTNGNVVEHLSLEENDIFKKDCNLSFTNNNDNIYCINESNTFSNDINDLIKYYKSNNYNQRWVGSMVADCHQILCKGGIFMYPDSTKHPSGKLRVLYEVLPFSYIFKIAGGVGLDTNLNNILEIYNNYVIKKEHIHKSIPVILCSKKEYNILTNYLEIRENIFC
jgi:fructose-1,6-bisphosphatase I